MFYQRPGFFTVKSAYILAMDLGIRKKLLDQATKTLEKGSFAVKSGGPMYHQK
jgi:hypothetical protein